MNRNVEIKAKVAGLAAVRDIVERFAGEGPIVLEQEDIFFTRPDSALNSRMRRA